MVSYWSTTAEGITLGLLVGELWINKYVYMEGEDFFQGARMSLGSLGERWEFQEKIYHSQQGKDRRQNPVIDQVIYLINSVFFFFIRLEELNFALVLSVGIG